MNANTRHWQRLRSIEIDPTALAQRGTTLTDAVRSVDASAPAPTAPLDAPSTGWRPVAQLSPTHSLLAAPAAPDSLGAKQWWLAQLEHVDGGARVRFLPGPEPETRSRAEAARDLELVWPDVLDTAPAIEDVVVDIVNRGTEVRRAGTDGFLVIGRLLPIDTDGEHGDWVFGFGGSIPPEVVLGPGEYARVPVLVSTWEGIIPGLYDLHVTATAGISTALPRRVEVTAEDVMRRTRRPRARFIGEALGE